MDGIVKGDIPRTAATGFGFHLQSERRPVASAEVVKNVGLRPTPIPVSFHSTSRIISEYTGVAHEKKSECLTILEQTLLQKSSQKVESPFRKVMGLVMPRASSRNSFKIYLRSNTAGRSKPKRYANRHQRIYSPSVETSNENKHSPRRLPPPPGLGLGLITNSSVPLLSRPLPELPTSKPTEDTQVHDFAYGPRATLLKRSSRASVDITSYYSGNPDTTPSISESGEELDTVSVPLTPMEKNEMQGYFGAGPLEVVDGIAVTEEAVGLHVPDLITQF